MSKRTISNKKIYTKRRQIIMTKIETYGYDVTEVEYTEQTSMLK